MLSQYEGKSVNESINYILKHQCEAVGIQLSDIDPTCDKWYSDHTWIQEQEDGFIDWLANELYESTDLRNDIMFNPHKTKKRCKDCAKQWVFQYGWRVSC
jgi:hypothetical protein